MPQRQSPGWLTTPTQACRRELFTFLSAGGSRLGARALVVEELMDKTPFGLAASSLGLELDGRGPGINNFSNAVGNGNNFGVHG